MTLPFDANCAPMAPFDLPYSDDAATWAALLRWTPEVLVWPAPPRETAWYLAAAGFPGLGDGNRIDQATFETAIEGHQLAFLRYDIERAAVPAVARLTERLPWRIGDRPSVQAVVVGLYGPLSLGLTLVDADERPLFENALMHEVITQHLSLRMSWLESQLATSLICLIEPFWASIGSPFVAQSADDALLLALEAAAPLNTPVGLAPSGVVDWLPILRSRLRLIVCEPTQWPDLLACGACVNEYFERGGVVAWALVPSDPERLDRLSAADLVAEWDALLKQAIDQDVLNSLILSGSLLTVQPGLRQHGIAAADRALATLAETSRLIKARYKL